MGETCLPDELRTLFLFEKLTDRQLKSLCDERAPRPVRAGSDLHRG